MLRGLGVDVLEEYSSVPWLSHLLCDKASSTSVNLLNLINLLSILILSPVLCNCSVGGSTGQSTLSASIDML